MRDLSHNENGPLEGGPSGEAVAAGYSAGGGCEAEAIGIGAGSEPVSS
jgi:hypothetical protein